jgi:hypothetical protein
MCVRVPVLMTAMAAVVLGVPTVDAADHFLTIGGGPNPQNNQVSLERNVLFLQRTLAGIRGDQPPHAIFFADGKSPQRDLQFRDHHSPVGEADRWMARLWGDEDDLNLSYRSSEIPGVSGPARLAFLEQHFQQLAQRLGQGDRLIIYVSGHGGGASDTYRYEFDYERGGRSSESANRYNTSIHLWNDEEQRVDAFCNWLDQFRPDVEVVLVMVQCYAGGFGHAIFHQADQRLGLSPRPRCGFFSQRHDRPSAGCTPEIDEADYQEYSSFFWAAIGGQTRSGDHVDSADYDGDGQVSMAEAHAYAVITSDTIDIPVRTSDYFLRRYSRVGPKVDAADVPADEETPQQQNRSGFWFRLGRSLAGEGPQTADFDQQQAKQVDGLLTLATPIDHAMEVARPDRRAIIERLCEEFQIDSTKPISTVQQRMKKLEQRAEKNQQQAAVATAMVMQASSDLITAVRTHWPELRQYGYSPMLTQLTTRHADQFLKLINEHPQADAYVQAEEKQTEAGEKAMQLAKREAKLHRLFWQLRSVVLEANLPQVAPADRVAAYERLRAQEERTLIGGDD